MLQNEPCENAWLLWTLPYDYLLHRGSTTNYSVSERSKLSSKDIDIYIMFLVCRNVIQGTNLVIMMVKNQYTYVSVRLSVQLSVWLALSLFLSVCFCRSLSLSLSVSLSLSLSLSLCLSDSLAFSSYYGVVSVSILFSYFFHLPAMIILTNILSFTMIMSSCECFDLSLKSFPHLPNCACVYTDKPWIKYSEN